MYIYFWVAWWQIASYCICSIYSGFNPRTHVRNPTVALPREYYENILATALMTRNPSGNNRVLVN